LPFSGSSSAAIQLPLHAAEDFDPLVTVRSGEGTEYLSVLEIIELVVKLGSTFGVLRPVSHAHLDDRLAAAFANELEAGNGD
jgi:hypothetical protein